MHAFGAIARLAALETVRRPVCLLVTLATLAGTTLMPFFLPYTLGCHECDLAGTASDVSDIESFDISGLLEHELMPAFHHAH